MEQQNFKTHKRLIFGYHGFTALAIFALIVGSIMNLINSAKDNYYSASLLVLISVVMLFMWFYIRSFALKAQDRAINAEESLRAFILSGKPMNNNLTIRQVIGLRFASDDEYVLRFRSSSSSSSFFCSFCILLLFIIFIYVFCLLGISSEGFI